MRFAEVVDSIKSAKELICKNKLIPKAR